MESAKKKITRCVAEYIKLFPDEYKLFQAQVKEKRGQLFNEWGEVALGSQDNLAIERQLLETPEKLHYAIVRILTTEEEKWKNSKKGIAWFMKTYPAFNVTKEY